MTKNKTKQKNNNLTKGLTFWYWNRNILREHGQYPMAADALAPCIARASAAMILTMKDKGALVFLYGKIFELSSYLNVEMK